MLTGKRFTAAECERMGLVNGVVPRAEMLDAARALAQDAVIVDTHIDAPGMLTDRWMDLGVDAPGR
jgi:enoyl-CoA hydratase/carnithine racemase